MDLDQQAAQLVTLANCVNRLTATCLRLAERVVVLEVRVSDLENHPAGCACARCTG